MYSVPHSIEVFDHRMGYVCFKIKSPAFASINTPYWLDFKVRLEDLQCTNRLGTGAVGTLHKGCSITIAE